MFTLVCGIVDSKIFLNVLQSTIKKKKTTRVPAIHNTKMKFLLFALEQTKSSPYVTDDS